MHWAIDIIDRPINIYWKDIKLALVFFVYFSAEKEYNRDINGIKLSMFCIDMSSTTLSRLSGWENLYLTQHNISRPARISVSNKKSSKLQSHYMEFYCLPSVLGGYNSRIAMRILAVSRRIIYKKDFIDGLSAGLWQRFGQRYPFILIFVSLLRFVSFFFHFVELIFFF